MNYIEPKGQSEHVLLSGILIMLAGALLTLLIPLSMKIMGLALFTFGFFGAHSIASSWIGKLADKSEKAQASSLYLLFYYGGSSIVGATGRLFLIRFGWGGVISIVALSIITAALCIWLMKKVK